MFRLLISSILILCSLSVRAQQVVSFYAQDGLKITADLYLMDNKLPFILLFHQGEASRGEYSEIAKKLLKLDYNCMAVDLRYGEKINYTRNETAITAREGNFDQSMMASARDIKAAIDFVSRYNKQEVILFGSSYSASLCLLEAVENVHIKAVIAMSPGEYFRPEIVMKDKIRNINQPVFISSTNLEYNFIREMFAASSQTNLHFFQPSQGRGDHGAKMLWGSSASSDQCWLDLLLFFKGIRY